MHPWLRRALTSLPLIVVVALGLRLGSAWDYQAKTPHTTLRALPFLFESGNIAYSIASGRGFGSPFRVLRSPSSRRDHSRRAEPEAGLLTIEPEAVVHAADELLSEATSA